MENERKHEFELTEEALDLYPNIFPVADKKAAVGTKVMLTDAEARIVGILEDIADDAKEAVDAGSSSENAGNTQAAPTGAPVTDGASQATGPGQTVAPATEGAAAADAGATGAAA